MSGEAYISGRISITPPVTWTELRDKPWAVDGDQTYPDVRVWLDSADEDLPTGRLTHYAGVAVVPTDYETSAYELMDQVQRIVDAFGSGPGGVRRVFAGFLHVTWGHGSDTTIYRVLVRDGKAVEVSPEMVWPEGARDEDAVVADDD